MASTKPEMSGYRSIFSAVFNPKLGEGYLIYKDDTKERKVKCLVSKLPFFGLTEDTVDDCLISLTACNPYWEELQEIKAEIALWIGSFSFPLEIIESGIEMGYRMPSLIVNVLNEGDSPSGMRIEFKALATLDTPSILNVNDQTQFIRINKTMVAGEVISITTGYGNKRVESTLNGVATNAFAYIDLGSTFMQLDVGDNLLRYDAVNGLDNLVVSIYFVPMYLGV